jgi:hypothetical protein
MRLSGDVLHHPNVFDADFYVVLDYQLDALLNPYRLCAIRYSSIKYA